MAQLTAAAIKGEVMRLTKLDICGNPVTGAESAVLVTDGFVSLDPSPEYSDPESIEQRNANGALCINEQDEPELQRVGLDINWCVLDPDALVIVTGQQLLTSGVTGTGVAFQEGRLTERFSLETWQRVAGFNSCDASGSQKYVYWAWPNIGATEVGDYSVENAALEFQTTSTTKAMGNLWLDRLDPDWLGANVPLEGTHFLFNITTIAPPAVTDGAVILS